MKVLLPLLSFIAVCLMLGCGSGSSGGNPSGTNSPTPPPTPIGTRAILVTSISPTTVSASGGQILTINGEGFSGRTNLKVFSISLRDVVVESDTKITAVIVSAGFSGSQIERDIYVIGDGVSSLDLNNRVKIVIKK